MKMIYFDHDLDYAHIYRRGLFGSAAKTLPQLKVDSGRKTVFEFDYHLKRIAWKTLSTDKMPCDEERQSPDTTRQG